ncbi:MAG: phosphotransferase [Promethearchaeota archaeon]|nr:MAG: phosphotransferase [Candidatus Lokiarchaeota archaeon]
MTFFEERRAPDISKADVIDSLYIFFPDISEEDIRFFYHGTYNVYEVKNQFIFRIPDKHFRNFNGVRLIQNEVKMLYHIQKYVSVSIPEPIYISLEKDCPLIGYKKIEGSPLSRCFYKASKDQRIKIAKEIGLFLSELHSNDLFQEALKNKIVDNVFSCKKYKKDWQKFLEEVQTTVFHMLNSAQRKWITNLFDKFLNNEKNFDFKYTIIHGDFDISNIIVNPKTFKITGIVDFEESRIYDPAADFLFYDEGDAFVRSIFSSYTRKIDDNFEERMKFLYGWSFLAYIKFGIEHNLSDMIEAGFQLLKIKMEKFPT